MNIYAYICIPMCAVSFCEVAHEQIRDVLRRDFYSPGGLKVCECMCMCMYVYAYVYVYVCVTRLLFAWRTEGMWICMHVYACLCVCVCVYVCMYGGTSTLLEG